MSERLANAYRVRLCVQGLEEDLLRKAEEFHRMGFHHGNLSPSQMAAVAERLASASTPNKALEGLKEFIGNQLRRLKKKWTVDGRVASWLIPFGPKGESGPDCLGTRLEAWAAEAACAPAGGVPDAARLSLMRSFWNVLQAHCRHHRAFDQAPHGKGEERG